MLDVDVLKAKMFEFHRSELKYQFGLTALILEPHLLDFAKNERFHFDGVKAESSGELEASFIRNNSGFKNITPGETLIMMAGRLSGLGLSSSVIVWTIGERVPRR